MDFDLWSPALRDDPYPYYDRLRAEAPVHRSHLGPWLLARHSDGEGVLRGFRRFANIDPVAWHGAEAAPRPLHAVMRRFFLFRHPPDHTRLRTLVAKAFTPRAVEHLRGRIEEIVEERLDAAGRAGGMDVVADFVFPVPVRVICEMLGVSADERDRLRAWTQPLAAVLDSFPDPERLDAAESAVAEFSGWLRDRIRDRRENPIDCILSGLIAAEEVGDRLTEDEIVATSILLIAAGHETTTHLITNAVFAVLRHPEAAATLREAPALATSAVEETLRWESPVKIVPRVALEDVEIGGHRIASGEIVAVLVGATNRDPERFANPHRFDIHRGDDGHLSFGHGIRFCIGAPLARLEAAIALNALVRREPGARLAGERLEWLPGLTFRSLRSLRVAF